MLAMLTGSSDAELGPMPLPADWVLEGTPAPRGKVILKGPDRRQFAGIWECPAGRFRYEFAYSETVRILEGEATITDETGQSRTFTAGDLAHFPIGLKTTWHVPRYVKKVFFILTAEPVDL
jgi:uncharacterized cupin superfamily protein